MSTYRATLVGLEVTVAFVANLLDGSEYRASTQVPLVDSRSELETYLKTRISVEKGIEVLSITIMEVF